MPQTTTIIHIPNPTLRQTAKEVLVADISTSKIRKLIVEMKKTLQKTPDGVGLAAPQVDESLQIFIVSEEAEEIDRTDPDRKRLKKKDGTLERGERPYEQRDWKYYVFINPIVKNVSKSKVEGPEGCLSVPGKYGNVVRHEKITVQAYDENGKKFTRGTSHFFARVMQHELDHLKGTLFIDKAYDILEITKEAGNSAAR